MINIFHNPLFRQYAVVILVNLSVLSTGVGLVWVSPVLVKLSNSTQTILPRPITEVEGSWIVSIGSLIALPANILLAAFLVDRIGRKTALIMAAVPKIIGSFLFIFANEVWMLYLGRSLVGISDTGIFTIVPMYASEIASKEIRGSLGTFLQIMCSMGVVIMLSMGPFLDYVPLNVIYTCIVVTAAIPLVMLPESPYFLYSQGKKEESLKVLTYLRGSQTQANEEFKEYELASEQNMSKVSRKEILKNKLFWKSLFLALVIGMGLQLVGFNAVSFYLQTILESTQTSVSSQIASVVVGLIQLFASLCTTLVTDRFGRKPILTTTCIGTALGMFGLGLFFKLKDGGPVTGFLNFLPLASLILVVFCFSAGLGSLFWVLSAELFDDRSRGLGMSISLINTGFFMFLLSKYFALVTMTIGPAATYWIFSVNCVLLCLFIMFCVPETKGKSFAEIQVILENKDDGDKKKLEKC